MAAKQENIEYKIFHQTPIEVLDAVLFLIKKGKLKSKSCWHPFDNLSLTPNELVELLNEFATKHSQVNAKQILKSFELYLHDEYGENIVSGSIDDYINNKLQSQSQEVEQSFEIKLQEELNKLPYEKHADDGGYNDGQVAGFEQGARWAYKLSTQPQQVKEGLTAEEFITTNYRSRFNPLLDKANRTMQQYSFDDVVEFAEAYHKELTK